jgi:hypothetical protein
MPCKSVARRWPDALINAIYPRWLLAKMRRKWAPGDLQNGYETLVWLSTSNDKEALVKGKYFF